MSSKSGRQASDIFDRLETLIRLQSDKLPAETSVQQVLIDLGTPIVSVAILEAGKITAKIIGSPEPSFSTAIPFNADTLFQACSISKPLTALAVIKLCQEGTLDLDVSVFKYLSSEQLSWISTPKTLPLVSQISLRNLLSHTAGLSTHGFLGYARSPIPSLEQTLRGEPPTNHESIRLVRFPGQKFSYSGGGFQVVQLIVETTLKKPFHEIMEDVILKPLGMTRSTYQRLPDGETNYAPAYLTGKNISDPDHHFLVESAAAGLWTTPSDLLKVIHAVQKSIKSGDLLERAWAEKMLTEVGDNGMAIGWATKKGRKYFGHAGDNMPGYVCYFAGYTDAKSEASETESMGKVEKTVEIPAECGVVVMTSSALGDLAMGKIMAAIPYLKGWPSLFHHSIVPFADHEKTVDEQAKEWCGKWGPGNWNLVTDEGRLKLQSGHSPLTALVPAALPPFEYKEGKSIDLVADGLETMLRLGLKEGVRIIELWQDEEQTTLKST